jgi:hypothetical protein
LERIIRIFYSRKEALSGANVSINEGENHESKKKEFVIDCYHGNIFPDFRRIFWAWRS